MKPKRRLYSLVPLTALFLLLLPEDPRTVLLLPLGLLALEWYSMGVLFLASVIFYLVYMGMSGLYGLTVVSLAVLTVETAYLDRELAPREHYAILTGAVLAAFPTYILIEGLSEVTPPVEVTAVAAVFLVVLYLFAKMVME